MNKIAGWPADKRRELFSETAAQKGMIPAIVEKDFWVCWVLMRLFKHPDLSKKILFKGGTSLSKVFHLIERFSEDIDLILDWRLLTNEEPDAHRSKTQQGYFNQNVLGKANDFIQYDLLAWVKQSVGELCQADVDKRKPTIIHIRYPGVFEDQYLLSDICLEIGPLAAWMPNDLYEIVPYAAEVFPSVFSSSQCKVNVIKAERTFWEKVTILHREAFRLETNVQPARYSRHYYDLACMYHSFVKKSAFDQVDLLEKVVSFKQRFYPSAGARYDLAKSGSMRLMPPIYVEKILRKDYQLMRDMIFGEYPEFEKIVNDISSLEREINALSCE